jgi:hypothetical protein
MRCLVIGGKMVEHSIADSEVDGSNRGCSTRRQNCEEPKYQFYFINPLPKGSPGANVVKHSCP